MKTKIKYTGYERRKERARKQQSVQSASGRNIGAIPECVDPERKESCRNDFKLFCETYFPETFYLGWSPDHLKAIRRIEQSVFKGGLFALAMPRGDGKTTLCETAVIWAIFYGHRAFVAVIGATEDAAQEILSTIKTTIETNEMLQEDFPEICYPIQKLDGIANRCNGQLYNGDRTRIRWNDAEIVLPSIRLDDGTFTASSGAVVRVTGITGRVRGMKYLRTDGKNARPDLVIIDDPQTHDSANSVKQTKDRIKVLEGDILGLSGPGKKISGIMPCTVIQQGDMADQILDPEKHPDWNGERCALCYKFPDNEALWDKYAEIRADSLRKFNDIREATEFYMKNQREMDKGCLPAWPDRHGPDEVSAVQNIMNLKFKDEASFWSEYQNAPLPEDEDTVGQLTEAGVMNQLNGLKQEYLPMDTSKITMFVDVMQNALYYVVMAFSDEFTGAVIDYGTFPKQKTRDFTVRDMRLKLCNVYPDMQTDGYIYRALERLVDEDYMLREFQREDGAMMKISRCLIDANWGAMTDVVYLFCRRSKFSSLIFPSHGKYFGPASKPLNQYRKKQGDKIGVLNWMIPNVKGTRAIRHVIFDTNFWKSYVRLRLQTQLGQKGSMTLWGHDPEKHRMFAEHMCSEFSVQTEGRGRKVDEWKIRPKQTENHWFDGVVGCSVAASIEGCVLPGTAIKRKKRIVKRVELPPAN